MSTIVNRTRPNNLLQVNFGGRMSSHYAWVYISGLIIGILLALAARRRTSLKARRWLYGAIAQFALVILLPLHIFFTITRSKTFEIFSTFGVVACAGAATSLLIFILSYLLTKKSSELHVPFIAATFAGAGRS